MRAHRFKVVISESHEIHVQLPQDVAPGEVEVIVLEAGRDHLASSTRKYSVDELLAARLPRPAGVSPVSLADMEAAIAEGAAGRGGA